MLHVKFRGKSHRMMLNNGIFHVCQRIKFCNWFSMIFPSENSSLINNNSNRLELLWSNPTACHRLTDWIITQAISGRIIESDKLQCFLVITLMNVNELFRLLFRKKNELVWMHMKGFMQAKIHHFSYLTVVRGFQPWFQLSLGQVICINIE